MEGRLLRSLLYVYRGALAFLCLTYAFYPSDRLLDQYLARWSEWGPCLLGSFFFVSETVSSVSESFVENCKLDGLAFERDETRRELAHWLGVM